MLTIAALPHRCFARALEPRCANGALTERLAPKCDHVVTFDFEPSAIARARQRVESHAHVDVVNARFPDWWPHGGGDLVVWSEVAYYLDSDSADRALGGLDIWLALGGTLVAVHYTGDTNYPRHGSAIGPWLDSTDFLQRTTTVVDETFELGVWTRVNS